MPPTSARDPLTTTIGIGVLTGIWLCCLYSIRQRDLARRISASSESRQPSQTSEGISDANVPSGSDLDQVHGLFAGTDRPLSETQRDGTGDTGAVLAPGDDEQARLVADDNVTEHDIQEEDQDEEDDSQPSHHLKELAYAIARHNTDTENTVHHGINCDGCNQHPLRGVRYKCANCHDFDFCERCEATESHLATHVFLKIKIPLVRINVKPARAFYPGRPMHMPSEPSSTTVSAVRKKSSQVFQGQGVGVNDDAVRAAYAKFICLADVAAPQDPSMVERGISFAAFQRLMPLPDHDMKMYDLLFRFYTEGSSHTLDGSAASSDGRPVISFFQYFIGSLIIQKNKYCPDGFLWRIFRCLDVDQDGYLSRQDVISALRATHEFNVACIRLTIDDSHIAEDALEMEGERDPRTYIEGSGSLGAYFSATGLAPTLGPNPRAGQGKALDEGGDLVPTAIRQAETDGTLRQASYLHHRGGGTISQSEAVQKSWKTAEQDFQQTLRKSASGSEWTAFDRTWRVLPGQHPNYYEEEGRLFLKFSASAQIFEGTLFVSPCPNEDRATLRDLKRFPGPIRHRDIRVACQSIRERCISQNIRKKREHLEHRQEAGHLAQYEEDPQPQQDEESGNNGITAPTIHQETDSIYNITEEAFNEILDDMFAPAREKMSFEEFYGLVQGRPIKKGEGDEGGRTAYRHVHRDVPDDDEEEGAEGSGTEPRGGPTESGAASDNNDVARDAGAIIMEHMRAVGRVESKAAKRVCDWAWGWVGVAYF